MKRALVFNNFLSYEFFIVIGVLMVIGTGLKLLHVIDFSSDWFWLLAGVGLIVEGFISLTKQKRFDRKYKVIEISEENKTK